MWGACVTILVSCFYQSRGYLDYDWDTPGDHLSVEVMSHSFTAPFKYASSFPNWMISGSSVYTSDTRTGVILNPGVPERHGVLFNEKTLSSNNFDMTLTLYLDEGKSSSDDGERPLPALNQSVSLWFSRKSLSSHFLSTMKGVPVLKADWSDHMHKGGFDPRTGGPVDFDGIRLVINLVDEKSGKRIPSLRLAVGTEERSASLFSADGEVTRGRLMFLRVRLSVRADSVGFYLQERGEWVLRAEIKDLKSEIIPAEGYIGISSFSGLKSERNRQSSQVRLGSLHVKSFDLSALLTSENNNVVELFEAEKLPLKGLLTNEAFTDPIEQTDTLIKLSRMLEKYTRNTIPQLVEFRNNITSLQKEISGLEEFVTSLAKETKYTFAQSRDPGKLSALMNDIKSIHQTISDTESQRDTLLDKMSAQVRDSPNPSSVDRHLSHYERQVHERNEELASSITQNNRMSLVFLLIVVVAALAMGLLFYRNLNMYARKAHIF